MEVQTAVLDTNGTGTEKKDGDILSAEEKSQLFKSLLDTLFTRKSEPTNQSRPKTMVDISDLTLDEEKVLIITSLLNTNKTQENVLQQTPVPLVVFDTYLRRDSTKTLWEVFRLLDKRCLKKYLYQLRPEISCYICTQPNDVTNNLPVSSLCIDTLSCSTCGHFSSIEQCCCHILLLYLHLHHRIAIPEVVLWSENEWLLLERRSAQE